MNPRAVPFLLVAVGLLSCSGERAREMQSTTPRERFVVGSSGGTFTTVDGVGLDVPAGALTATITITVSRTTLPDGNALTPVSSVFQFEPAGTEFAAPVTLRIPYIGGTTEPLGFWYTGEDAPTILSRLPGATLANGVGAAMVTHFSIGCVAYPSGTSGRDAGVSETMDAGHRDAGTTPRDGGGERDAGPARTCGCEPGPKCGACCEGQEVCGYTECYEMHCAE